MGDHKSFRPKKSHNIKRKVDHPSFFGRIAAPYIWPSIKTKYKKGQRKKLPKRKVRRPTLVWRKVVPYVRPSKKPKYDKGRGKKLPKQIQNYIVKVKQYKKREKKSVKETKAFNLKLKDSLKKAGYPTSTYRRIEDYSVTSKVSFYEFAEQLAKVRARRYRTIKGKKVLSYVYIGKKWITVKQFRKRIMAAKYRAQVKSYCARYGLTKRQAQILRKNLRDPNWGWRIYDALY